ncbi:hypothetical protein [Mariniblastus fucicola]|uniref:Transmembrane protein n=1 Tax=Mariniblastus fucicola TaxID=980251 RepID=A0A5B9PHM0_9BACT|nr:hypothetical protein [Mariniblastus fucicola]QEG24146.1 hypothetical protein MFFC18_40620 [Mariniblastus fucicola]
MADLIRNRVTERDIGDWLKQNGFETGSTVIESVELHAIKRPGWEQLFRFTGRVRPQASPTNKSPQQTPVWGIAIDDERKPTGHQTKVILCDSEAEQKEQLAVLSADMMTARSRQGRRRDIWSLLGMALFCVAILFAIGLVKRLL